MKVAGGGIATIAALTLGFSAVTLTAGTRTAIAADDPQQQQPTPERIKAAAEEFDRGRRAFLAKDYEPAAGHFENAFRDAPSKETLRLAIRARREAKQPARAATLAAVAQDKYASDPATAALAKETLAETTKDLSEYVVDCAQPCTIAADGRVVSQTADATHHRVFLDPGAHDLGVSFQQGGSLSKHVEGKKGQSEKLSFEAPPAPPPTSTTTSPTATTTSSTATTSAPPPPPPQKPLGPAVFFIGAGLTVIAGGATIFSGIDTQNRPGQDAVRRDCAGQGKS